MARLSACYAGRMAEDVLVFYPGPEGRLIVKPSAEATPAEIDLAVQFVELLQQGEPDTGEIDRYAGQQLARLMERHRGEPGTDRTRQVEEVAALAARFRDRQAFADRVAAAAQQLEDLQAQYPKRRDSGDVIRAAYRDGLFERQ